MDEWICRQNIEHFRQQLAITSDELQRVTLLKLLAAEEAKFKSIEHESGSDAASKARWLQAKR